MKQIPGVESGYAHTRAHAHTHILQLIVDTNLILKKKAIRDIDKFLNHLLPSPSLCPWAH